MKRTLEPSAISVASPVTGARQRFQAAAVSILLGVVIIYGVGFAPGVLHGSAHDSRHSVGLICH